MEKFHKWCYESVLALGVFCLWYEIAMLSFRLLGSWTPGFIIGMFFIGWAVSYKDDKGKEERISKIFEDDKKD